MDTLHVSHPTFGCLTGSRRFYNAAAVLQARFTFLSIAPSPMILAASTVGEHLVTICVPEYVNYPAAFSRSFFCSLSSSTAL